MSFHADSGRIWIEDAGEVVFDTDTPMPSIFGIWEGEISHTWSTLGNYWDSDEKRTIFAGFDYEETQPLADLPSFCDFVICRVTPIDTAGATADWIGAWPVFLPAGATFFQGSALVEALPSSQAEVFVRRLLHVYPDNNWGKLVAVWHHSSRRHAERRMTANGAHTTRLQLKAWYGGF
ncbi:hypothetical protein LCM08_06120 [Salipiger pacificus]|nr:hypothetical protein [Alloyangia pacifica]